MLARIAGDEDRVVGQGAGGGGVAAGAAPQKLPEPGAELSPARSAQALFPGEPALAHFVRASFSDVRERISHARDGVVTDVCTIWGTPSFTGISERQAVRPDKGEFRGTVTDGNDRMPYVGFWLSNPGTNRTVLLSDSSVEIDHTLVQWFQDAGIGGDVLAVKDTADLARQLRESGRALYGCDNYGPVVAPYIINSGHDFDLVSDKSWTRRLVGDYAPYEEIIDMFSDQVCEATFSRVKGQASRVYVKLCNDEHGGMGVKPVETFEQFAALVEQHQAHTRANSLSPNLVLQRGIEGQARSFCFFLDGSRSDIPMIAVTDQVVDPGSGRDLGNLHYPVTAEVVRPLTGMIATLRENILAQCPNAFGFVMCDFIQRERNGATEIYAIDPGLRPSASSPSAMAQMWLARATGRDAYVRNNLNFRFDAGFSWGDLTKKLPQLTDPATILATGRGVVPFSWEPRYGTGRTITMAADAADHDRLIAEVRAACGTAVLD